jgi:hypothetical protein
MSAVGIAASAVAGGVIGGAPGSIANQGVGVLTGIQKEFSWNAVAFAGIGGGIGAGRGQVPAPQPLPDFCEG